MKHIWTDQTPKPADKNMRSVERRPVALPARLTWKDQRGATRFATVVARNVSDFGVYVECQSPVSIPLYRLVQFQLERDVYDGNLPGSLQTARSRALGRLSCVSAVVVAASGSGVEADDRPGADGGDRFGGHEGDRVTLFSDVPQSRSSGFRSTVGVCASP